MSKKKLLEFGLKEADAFQKNFKIIFDRLVRGYRSMMGKEPEGLDLLKVKMEAREKALNTTKVVNQKGLTLDPDKPIMGGTQEGIPTIKTKFDEDLTVGIDTIKDQMGKIKSTSSKLDEVMKEREAMFKPKPDTDDFNLSKDDPMGDLEKIVKGEGNTGLPKQEAPQGVKTILEEELGVKLYGDETFDELMIIKNTGKHPRDMADGGQVPAAPSQLVSESDMILGYRGPGGYQGGGGNKSSGGGNKSGGGGNKSGGGGNRPNMADVAGPVTTPPSVSTPRDLGFIESTTTFTPDPGRGSTGTTIVGPGPTGDGPGPGYVMSTTPPPSLLDKAITTGTNIINNPITKSLGLGVITAINPALGGKLRRGMMVKGMLEATLADIESAPGEVLEDMTIGTDVTGNTTALYKDGGLASMFVEKR